MAFPISTVTQTPEASSPPPSPPTVSRMTINNLPAEILAKIFTEYIYDHSLERAGLKPLTGSYRRVAVSKGAVTSPLQLGHVCALWRTAVFFNPGLWSHLYVDRPEEQDAELLKLWCKQGRSTWRHPLYLTFIQKGTIAVNSSGRDLFWQCLEESMRWRTAILYLNADMEDLITDQVSHLAPMLQAFHLNLYRWPHKAKQRFSERLLSGPFVWKGAWSAEIPFSVSTFHSISWSSLSSISIGWIQLSDLLEVVQLAPNVAHLSVCILFEPPSDLGQPSSPHRLNRLQWLEVTNPWSSPSQPSVLQFFLDSLILPSLTTIVLRPSKLFYERDWLALSELVDRSGCNLETLVWPRRPTVIDSIAFELQGTESPQCDVLEQLKYVSSNFEALRTGIRHLEIQCKTGRRTVDHLTISQEEEALFPSLRSIKLQHCVCVCHAGARRIEQMRESRQPTLVDIDVGSTGDISEDPFETWRSTGILGADRFFACR
ncbi:hypothetical protein D9611_013917 [Ephemerocybe angulata]|uniref:F-box domain-containing protein n=1 Tax=Ephemerocybe angulata TaxID=980116 RepID=A0A8H5B8X2_9AGAR|nr:hypothetical protein D9611_013917 [Tulosesus angulatus]